MRSCLVWLLHFWSFTVGEDFVVLAQLWIRTGTALDMNESGNSIHVFSFFKHLNTVLPLCIVKTVCPKNKYYSLSADQCSRSD